MTAETKDYSLNGNALKLKKLDPWKRLMFLADLQKEFLIPVLNSSQSANLTALLDTNKGESGDLVGVISAFSAAIDGAALERWVRRMLDEGMVYSETTDGKNMKLSLQSLSQLVATPMDILTVLKDAILFNVDDLGALMALAKAKPAALVVKQTTL